MNKEIKNRLAYFNKVVKNMDNLDLKKEKIRGDYEESSSEIEYLCYAKDEYFCDNLLDWIELVENSALHKALKSLNIEEQTLLGYLYFKGKTQTEVAKLMSMSQQKLNYKLHNLFCKIKKYFVK